VKGRESLLVVVAEEEEEVVVVVVLLLLMSSYCETGACMTTTGSRDGYLHRVYTCVTVTRHTSHVTRHTS
jgi:hypothetical protein